MLEHWPAWSARGGGGQYPPVGGGVQYPGGGGCGGHIRGWPTAGDPPHGIMGIGPISEPCNMKV
jgi:hypothetical protein